MEKKSRELLAPHVEEELMDYILHTPVKIGEKLPNEFELAELFGVGRSTVRETVKSLVSKGVLEVRRGSGTYVIGTNVEFHTYIARCSKNKVIEKLVPIIQSAVITFVNLTHRQLKDETIDTHRAITDAILNGDSAGAKYAMIMHLNYNRQMILKKQAKAQQKNE